MNAKISEKVKFYKEFNELAVKGEIAVFGSTYSAEFPFYELIQGRADYAVYNRSIEDLSIAEAADVAEDCLKELHPQKLFLCFGDEEANKNISADKVYADYIALVKKCKAMFNGSKIYLLPVMRAGAENINSAVRKVSEAEGVRFVTVAPERPYRDIFNRLNTFFRDHAPGFSEAFGV